jgi:hypothetical protein
MQWYCSSPTARKLSLCFLPDVTSTVYSLVTMTRGLSGQQRVGLSSMNEKRLDAYQI